MDSFGQDGAMPIKLPVAKFGMERMKDGSEKQREAHHRRLKDWEPFDEVTMKVVPRYKAGGFSGSKWRTGVSLEFRFKGELIANFMPRNMEMAIMLLGAAWISETECIPDAVLALEDRGCDQPGCKKNGRNKFVVKKLTSRSGDYLDMDDQYFVYYRQFCDEHVKRGDGDREDNDSNYEPIGDLFSKDTVTTPKVEIPEASKEGQNPTVLVSAIDMDKLVEKTRRNANGREEVYSRDKKSGSGDS